MQFFFIKIHLFNVAYLERQRKLHRHMAPSKGHNDHTHTFHLLTACSGQSSGAS